MTIKVLFHDNCFDGAASAAVFSRFYREKINQSAQIVYQGLVHKAGAAAIDDSAFTGDENAIVDFRFSQNPRLTWWFDHHQSAFQQAGDEASFRADRSGKKFHDPTRKSCTKYLAEIASSQFGFDSAPMAELIYWGELIDGAQFESPQMAVELKEPALKLMTVLESNKATDFMPKVILDLQTLSLKEIVEKKYVAEAFEPLLERHRRAIEVVRDKVRYENGIVFFDVADEGYDALNKFISYYLYPNARYTVWVGRSPQRAKVSIGCNPWQPHLRQHDLSRIAERYGGGGHPVVAAMSFRSDEIDRAREVASEILSELQH